MCVLCMVSHFFSYSSDTSDIFFGMGLGLGFLSTMEFFNFFVISTHGEDFNVIILFFALGHYAVDLYVC